MILLVLFLMTIVAILVVHALVRFAYLWLGRDIRPADTTPKNGPKK